MSGFDTTLNVIGTSLAAPTEEALEAGEPANIEVEIVIGQQLPFAAGPGQPPLMAPMGRMRYKLERESALEFFKAGLDAAEALPQQSSSKIEIASDLSGVEQAAKRMEGLRGA